MRKLYSIMLSRSTLVGIMIWLGWFVVLPTHAQVSGFVYRDFNADGVRTDTLPGELGMANVTVRIFLDRSTQPISTTTGPDGRYSFSAAQVPPGSLFRVEFRDLPAGFVVTPHGLDNRTTVQIGAAPATGVSLGINHPADYCNNLPTLVTPCYINGDPLRTTYDDGTPIPQDRQAATGDVLVAYPYTATGVAGKGGIIPTHLAFGAETGALWGVAYQRRSGILLSAAVIKRHTGLGPLGTGGIYQTDMATGQTRPYLDLQTLGINTGANPHSGLLGDKLMANYDSVAMNAVGRVGIGGIAISDDDKVLYLVNLNDKKVYGVTLNVPARNFIGSPVNPTAADTISWKIPDPGCVNGGFRPWAIQYYRGSVYVGGVCSAENADPKRPYADTSALRAVIYKFDPALGRNAPLTEVLSFPLSYTRGYADGTDSCANFKYWLPWSNMFPRSCNNNKHVMWPQPVLSDIVFDVDGSMGIGMLDRFGFLSGRHNFAPTQNDNGKLYDGFSSGDMLRVYNNNGSYQLEHNGQAGPLTGSGANSGQGPGGGEFYGDDYWLISSNGSLFVGHDEIFNGGLVSVPGKGEVLTTAYDPLTDVYQSGGIRAVYNRNGRTNRGYVLYADEPGTFGKASGLGDLGVICDVPPIELGNLLWFDDNRNGIQDPYEKGIPNILLTLHDMENNGVQVGQTTTSATGEFYFNNSNVTPKLLPNHRYQIRMNPQQLTAFTPSSGRRAAALAGVDYYLSPSNQIDQTSGSNSINSKGVVYDNYFVIDIITTDVGQTNHQLDLSVYACPNLSAGSDTIVACAATTISSLVINGQNFARDDSVRIVYFDTPQSGTAMYGTGGTVLGTYKPVNGQIVVNNPNLPAAVAGEKVYYIYAIVHPAIPDPNCRPYTSMVAVIKPKPIATITAGTLSCSATTAQLSVSVAYANGTPVTNSTYYWAGPNGFTSTSANPVVTTEGTYTVAVSTGICNAFPGQNFSTVVVNRIPETPVSVSIVEAFGPALSCSACAGSLTAVVSPSNATVLWTGPANFTSNQLNPTVNREGSYTLVATNTNGCRVVQDIAVVPVYTKTISVTATSICIKDTPYISYTIAAQHFVPPTNGATITVTKFVTGDTVLVMKDQPLSGTFLYPGAAVDSNGDPTDWPGWRFENGEWIQEDDGLRPRVVVHISINPTAEAVVFYPDPSPFCIGGPPMGLGDFVWKDFNRNGIQDAGEPGVPNVRVELYTVTNGQRSATPVSTTVTDSNGKYLFDRLGDGAYQVRFVPATFPAGCTLTVANQGDDKLDSDADADGYSQVVTLSLTDPVSPRPNRTIDAGLIFVPIAVTTCESAPTLLSVPANNRSVRMIASKTPLSLTGVCAGAGLNLGTAVAGTNGLSSLTTTALQSTSGVAQLWYVYATTTESVSAGATCLPVAELRILVNPQPIAPVIVEAFGPALSCSTCVGSLTAVVSPSNAAVLWTGPNNFTSNQLNPTVDRPGNYTLTASITNSCSVAQAQAVVPVYTKTISMTASSICIKDTPFISYTIAAQHFVPPTNGATITITKFVTGDTVLVMKDQPLSGMFLYPGAAVDSNGDPTDWPGWRFENGEWIQVDDGLRPRVVVHISINPTSDAVVFYPDPTPLCIAGPLMGIGDFVWKDFNKNGIQDAGEPGVPNVRVELYTVTNGQRSATPVSTTVTDTNGKYLFAKLGDGNYQVRFVPATFPTGCTLTVANQGDDKLDSDADQNGYSQVVTLNLQDPVSPRPNRTIDAGLVFVPVMATVCAGQPATLTLATGNQPSSVRFLASKIPLSLTDVCAGVGLNLGTATVGSNGVISLATSSLTATTGVDQRWYVYVTTTESLSAGATCLPLGEMQILATPVPQIPVILEAYGGALPCVACPVMLEVVTDPANASVLWRGPNSFTSTLHTPEVTRAGFYTVVASAKIGACTVVSQEVEVEVLPIIDDPCPVLIMSSDQTVCSGNATTAIVANTFNVSFGSQVRYVMFDTPQVDPAAIYESTSGTVVALAAPDDLGKVSLTSTTGIFVNNGTTPVTKYIYTTVYPEPADISCRPYGVMQVNVLPAISSAVSVTAIPATCSGPMALSNGSIVVKGFTAGDRYSIAAQTTGLATSYAAANPIPAGGVIAGQLNNPVSPLTYYVRVINSGNCYQDYTVVLTPTNCVCPAPVCVPMVIKRVR